MVYPNTGCPDTDKQYAIYAGHKTAYNTNNLASGLSATGGAKAAGSPANTPDDSMFVACSSDATCYPPFAHNTGCTEARNVHSMHFHFYFTSNDGNAVNASNNLISQV